MSTTTQIAREVAEAVAREIQAVLGHASGSRQTDRYIAPAGDVTRLDRASEVLGLRDIHLRREA